MVGGEQGASTYDEIYATPIRREDGCLREYFFQVEDRLLVRGMEGKSGRVLDIGTGNGRMFKAFNLYGNFTGFGVDLSAEGLSRASENFSNGTFMVADASNLPMVNASMDYVVAAGVFEMPGVLAEVLGEVSRVMRGNGEFRFTCWSAERWYGGRLLDRKLENSVEYSLSELKSLLACHGFEVECAQTTFFIPRRIFWGCYALLLFKFLRCWFLGLCAWLDTTLCRSSCSMCKGWEWVIVARKIPLRDD